ncbi:DNA sulfur modification protein DndB [Methylocystis sp. SC2]|uniref:DNA sulfur modification protein DndB n=1 Tax=Methylocystis sp. (strain SC2) TaxID=187303 RepID=UPI00027AEF5A|nr:DNA sulfur modification protein DndB [Methylocystis sp. SC2]CCJ07646.1 Putative DNA sulfur modification protein DndB [Methylocystis sp. SC2]
MPLNPTNGHIIAGTRVDENRFVGRVKAAQLFQLAPDPRATEDKKKLDASKEVQDLYDIRQDVQRLFEGQKKKNVSAYADYIVGLHNGEDGITPPITLFSETQLEVDEQPDGTCFIQIPWGEQLIAIDGETQLAARHEAANLEPKTKNEFVAIYLCHGRDKLWARQAFHDLNTLGVRPNAALSIGMDARDPLTRVCRDVERHVPFFKGRVNKVRRQLRSTDTDVVTITALRGACVTLAKGINGIQYGARPVPIDDAKLCAVEAAAVDWFTALTEVIGVAMEDRENKLAAAPSILAALGAVGNPLVEIPNEIDRKAKARQLAASLGNVKWERGKRWEGIAGKYTPKGAFAVGGAKETAYAVYSALTDPNDSGFHTVRVHHQVAA